jgi:hypothetical protein
MSSIPEALARGTDPPALEILPPRIARKTCRTWRACVHENYDANRLGSLYHEFRIQVSRPGAALMTPCDRTGNRVGSTDAPCAIADLRVSTVATRTKEPGVAARDALR